MIRTLRLHPPPGVRPRIENPVPTVHELSMVVPLEAAADPGAVVVWRDTATGVSGIFHRFGRTAWPEARVVRIHAIELRPDIGPGASGLELVLDDGAELPVLVVRPYREDFALWLKRESAALGRFLEVEAGWQDYGWDR